MRLAAPDLSDLLAQSAPRSGRRCRFMADPGAVLGVLAGLAGVADTVPYVRDIRAGTTRPHRGTWLIWAVVAVVGFTSQRANGASWSLVMSGTQAVLTVVVLALAVRAGEGGMRRCDAAMMAIAGVGVGGWILVDEPVVATACVVGADLVAAALMVPKTYRDPRSETLTSFALASVGGALAVAAVGTLDVSLLLYPAYFCVVNAALAALIYSRRRVLIAVAQRAPASRAR
jgi:hypothetical protein